MNVYNPIQIRQVEQVANQRIWTGTLQISVLAIRPGLHERQFTDSCAVHGTDPTQIEHELARMLQDLPYQVRERGRFIAVDDAAFAVDDDNVAMIPRFQTELQLRLLYWLKGSRLHRLRPRLPIHVA